MTRLRSPDALVLVGLLLLLVLLSLGIARRGLPPEDKNRPRRSVASPRPAGWKGWFLLLQQAGIEVVRVEQAPRDWPRDLPVLITGPAYTPFGIPGETKWDDKQVRAALAWVADGHALIVLADEENALLRHWKLELQQEPLNNAPLPPLQPAAFLAGVAGLQVPGRDRFVATPAGAVALFADARPVVLALRHGKGRVVLISDPALGDNKHLALADNARFLLQLVRAYAGPGAGRAGFDEYRQGFQQADSLWDAIGRPGQLTAWQLLALALLVAYSASRRFGLPRPLPAPSRVSSEYVASLADLYRRAHAADAALEGVYLSFWRDLCRAVSLPLDSPTDEVIRRAARTLRASDDTGTEERLRRVVNECEAKIEAGKIREGELLPLARDLEQLRKELGIGGEDRELGAAAR